MLRASQVVSKSRPVLQAVRPFFADRPIELSTTESCLSTRSDHDQAAQQQKHLVVQERPSLLNRWLDAGLIHLHRLLKLVTLRGSRASELYVRNMLEQEAGLDPFAVDFIALKHPAILHLSWQSDIEPVLAWLGSKGIRGGELATIVAACPPLLGKSVDEQLQPLADLVEEARGSLREVLLLYPDLANVPIDHLRGVLHVLRQLGASEAEQACLLLHYPDLYSQLAHTLRDLFNAYGRFGLKAYNAERRRYAGVVLPEGWGDSRGDGGKEAAGHGRAEAGAAAAAGAPGEGWQLGMLPLEGREAEAAGGWGGGQLEVGTEETQYICDSDVSERLKRVQATLCALAMLQPPAGQGGRTGEGASGGAGKGGGGGSPEDIETALSELQYELDRLAQVEGVCLRQDS